MARARVKPMLMRSCTPASISGIRAAGGDDRGRVIDGLVARIDGDRDASERFADGLRHASRFGIAFDAENHASEFRNHFAAEGLHGMKRTRGSAAARERRENGAVERGARVQNDFASAFCAAKFGESAHEGREIVVGRAKKHYIGGVNCI